MGKDKYEKKKKKLKKLKKELKMFSQELDLKEKELRKREKQLTAREKEAHLPKPLMEINEEKEEPIPAIIPEDKEEDTKNPFETSVPAKVGSAKFKKKSADQNKKPEQIAKGIKSRAPGDSKNRRARSKPSTNEEASSKENKSSTMAVRSGFKRLLELQSEEDISQFIEGDTRKTIQLAGEKRIRQIGKSNKRSSE